MKRFFLLLICLGSISLPVSKVDAKSSIYIQLGGSGVGISLNYEYFIRADMPLRVGLGTALFFYPLTTSITLSKLVGESRHKLELGGGISILDSAWSNSRSTRVLGIVGYRHQPAVADPIFRLSFTSFFATIPPPLLGISTGYIF